MTLQRGHSRKKNRALIGKELEVLVLGPSEEHEFVVEGRHRGQAPEVDGKVFLSGEMAQAGEIRRVRVDQATDYDLTGELIDQPERPKKKRRVALKVV
jgi:ribosomal protein S12 methylthiotransferase